MTNTDATDIMELSREEMDGALQIPALVKLLKEEVSGFEHCFISAIEPFIGGIVSVPSSILVHFLNKFKKLNRSDNERLGRKMSDIARHQKSLILFRR